MGMSETMQTTLDVKDRIVVDIASLE